MSRTSFKINQNETQISYLAGIIDGEGCFYIGYVKQGKYGSGYQWHSLVKVSNTDRGLIDWLEETFGGNREYAHCKKKPGWKPVYNWNATGEMLDYLLPRILNYLIIKKEHCEIMIEYRKTSKNIGSRRLSDEVNARRIELMNKIRLINSRFQDHPLKNPSPLSP